MFLSLIAAIFYSVLVLVPAAVAAVSWQNRRKAGATPLVVTAGGVGAATLVQAGRFLGTSLSVPEPVSVLLHIALLASINIAVLGVLYIAIEYTNRTWLVQHWLIAVLVLVGIFLPVGRILTETAGSTVAGPIADADFLYRAVLAGTGLFLFIRQYLGSQGVYRKQAGALCLGLGIGGGFGLLERFYTVAFVEFTLIGMIGGCVILAVALFRYEFLKTGPVARETLFDHVSDPVVALDAGGHVADANRAAKTAFGIPEDRLGRQATALFGTDEGLAAGDGVTLDTEQPIGGIVLDGRTHFDPNHPVIQALHANEEFPETEFAVVTSGEMNYYTVTSSELTVSPNRQGRLVVFREVTAERERAEDLDILKEVLSRVLRHNLRNEITVIRGFASSIAKQGDEEIETNANRISNRTEVLLKTSETARRIKNVIDYEEQVPVSLQELVDRAISDTREEYPDATFDTAVPDVVILVNPEFDTAFEEVIENALVHNDGGQQRISITAERTDRGVELVISDSGPGIPEYELDVLDRRGETSLDHGSGAGLWLIQIAVEHSNGTCQFETDSDGTTVRMLLPEASEADLTAD